MTSDADQLPDASEANLLTPHDIRSLAAALELRPTKQWGQNFVIDPNTIRKIVGAAQLSQDDTVLEVGPGLGSLTLELLNRAEKVIAVEIDPRLAERLPHTVAQHHPAKAGSLTVINQDALRIQSLPQLPTALVANLPYNVSVPVLLHLWKQFPQLKRGLVMVQTEVADRLAAPPGSRVYGVPSVKAAWYGHLRKVGSVARSVFWPVPNVESSLVSFERSDLSPIAQYPEVDQAWLFTVIDAAFAQRRKTLRSALAGTYGGAEHAEAVLKAAGIDPTLRGEKLSIEDFVQLARQR